MKDQLPNQRDPSGGGIFNELALRMKLILRLMADRRVNPLLKLLPIGSLLYLVIPDLLPGPVDDAVILSMGFYLFPELCPPNVVKEHWEALTSVVEGEWREVDKEETKPRIERGDDSG
jgi:uncharacterized membrane protein YkvA (DUF1232 family)